MPYPFTQTDTNTVMTHSDAFIEIQGTTENDAFHEHELNDLLALVKKGIREVIHLQQNGLGN